GESGFFGTLSKPIRRSRLAELLSRVSAEKERRKGIKASVEEAAPSRNAFLSFGGGEVRVLLVEDNPTNQLVVLSMLKKCGVRADVAENGQQALDALKKAPYDLVFMDCQMPIMDGYEATRKIRIWEREGGAMCSLPPNDSSASAAGNRLLPIIAITAHAMEGDREKCIDAGMSDYIAKPVTMEGIYAMLRKWLAPEWHRETVPDGAAGDSQGVANTEWVTEETPPDSPLAFDREMLLERLGGDETTLMMIMEEYVQDFPAKIHQIKEWLSQGALDEVLRQLHALRGTASTVCAEPLRLYLLQWENKLNETRDLSDAIEDLDQVERLYLQVKTAFEADDHG
ncbi:MAG: response regulator, partial [Kiritimatiellae bacterium]|nr:response regulator [Kiritimatiellia bacterium]